MKKRNELIKYVSKIMQSKCIIYLLSQKRELTFQCKQIKDTKIFIFPVTESVYYNISYSTHESHYVMLDVSDLISIS